MRRRDLDRRRYATPDGPHDPDDGAGLETLGVVFILLLLAYMIFLAGG